ncbi:MAG: cell wall metabolism sensor histidine kinase WalK [Chloroflexota bacterium]|nr:cell wall metabolism sensor histidine kinase WalK [Chloroflexota bacterium]
MLRSFRARALVAYVVLAAAALVALLTEGAPVALVIVVVALLALGAALLVSAIGLIAGSARVIAGASRQIAEGQFTVRLDGSPSDEIGAAYTEFNRMAARLESLVTEASQERSRLMAAINSSVDAVVATDRESTVTFANAAVQELLGRAPEEVVGRPFVWTMPDAEVIEGLRASRERGESSSYVIERPNRQFLRAIITPIVGGGAWSSLVVFHDMTDVKRVEQVRRDFVANVSHELRTPLAAIKSVIETLESGAAADPQVASDFLQSADGEVDRLVQMVEELLELSRIESGELSMIHEPVDLGAAVQSAVERLRQSAEKAGVGLSVDTSASLPRVSGDRLSLERAIVNLINNAIKFTPDGGAVRVLARPDGVGVTIEVADNGSGIEPQDLPRVFERFYKADRARRAGGTGLGLAVVKHTAEAHGGRVEAESRLGEGSSFRIWLPALPDAPAEAASD